MEHITAVGRNRTAMMYGLLVGVIYIVITTIANMLIADMTVFYAAKAVGYILYLVVVGILAARIRKANGGYIEFRELFGAVFIIFLIAGLLSSVYNYLYISVIDTHFTDKIRTSNLLFMEKMHKSPADIDKAVKGYDKEVVESKTFNLAANLFIYFQGLLLDCLFGLVVCAIVKKPRPAFDQV